MIALPFKNLYEDNLECLQADTMDESEYPPEFAELPETSEGDGMGPDNFSSYDHFDHGSKFSVHGEELYKLPFYPRHTPSSKKAY